MQFISLRCFLQPQHSTSSGCKKHLSVLADCVKLAQILKHAIQVDIYCIFTHEAGVLIMSCDNNKLQTGGLKGN